MKKINTLSQLADYINDCEDYPLDVEDICVANGWVLCKDDFDIAVDKEHNEKLSFTGDSDRVDVVTLRGGAREGSGRPTRYANKKRVQIYLSDKVLKLIDEHAEKHGMSRSDTVNYVIDTFFERM